MADEKFNRFDRQLTTTDLLNRILDMRANPFVVPDVAWDAQPVRYFKLNKQWCKILAGWLEWMEDIAGWQDAEDDNHAGIQGFLAFEEGINGTILMTPEEYYDANKRAIYDAFNDIAKQIVSGRTTNIAVGDDGTVTDPTTGGGAGAGLPEDDPDTTTINEEWAARTGGIRRAVDGLQLILTDMFDWYASYTPPSTGVIEQQAADRLVNLYQFESANATTFANYWYTVYQNSVGAVTLNETVLDGLFFCKGFTRETFASYIYKTHAPSTEVPVLEVFLENLNWQQMTDWFNQGVTVPSQEYYQYSCVPIENETLELDMSSAEIASITSVQSLKQNHRYKFRTYGQFTDTDNPNLVGDFYYMLDTLTGVKTYRSGNPFNSTGMNQPNANQVPYRADGDYTVILDKIGGAAQVNIARDNAPMNLPNVTGILTIEMEDLGEFTT